MQNRVLAIHSDWTNHETLVLALGESEPIKSVEKQRDSSTSSRPGSQSANQSLRTEQPKRATQRTTEYNYAKGQRGS